MEFELQNRNTLLFKPRLGKQTKLWPIGHAIRYWDGRIPRKRFSDEHVFTELVGVQMLLMNTLEPLLRGDKLAQEQLTVPFARSKRPKARKAQELLAKRSQNKEK